MIARMAELVLRLRDRELARVSIVKTRVTVGRDATSDLVIDNAAVSRTHATINFNNDTYRVYDEESENGLTVNGRRARKAALSYGDIVGIGKFEIELVESWHQPMLHAEPQQEGSKNVMKTMQVDAASAARLRDEAMARIAAQKGLPAPTPKVSRRPRSQASPSPSRGPAAPDAVVQSASAQASGPSTFTLVMLVLAALVAGAVLTLALTR